MQVFGVDALVRLASHLSFVYLAFWGIQSLKIDVFFKHSNPTRIRTILVLFSIGIGYLSSTFFWECLTLIRNFMLTIL